MKIIDFFKSSRTAKIGGFILFCSLMILISALSLGSLPSAALNPALDSVLDSMAAISGVSAAVGGAILAFAGLRRRFSPVNSVFIIIFSYEAMGFLAGLVIYIISLNPQNPLFPLSSPMSFFYYFLGILISAVSLICVIATSVCFALFLILKKIIKTKKTK